MSILSGSRITETELNNAFTGTLNHLRAEAIKPPSLYWVNFKFDGINNNSPIGTKYNTITFADDCIMEEAYLTIGNMMSAITATFDGSNLVQPILIMGSASANNTFTSFPRYFATGSNPYQVMLKGSDMIVTIKTNFTGSGNTIAAGIGLRNVRRID